MSVHTLKHQTIKGLQIRSMMCRPVLIDGRNIYEAAEMSRLGFIYRGMGCGTSSALSVLPQGDASSPLPADPELKLLDDVLALAEVVL